MAKAKRYPVFDGHNDFLLDYKPVGKKPLSAFFKHNKTMQADLPRAKAGNFAAGFYAVFVPDEHVEKMLKKLDEKSALNIEIPALDLTDAQSTAMSMIANLFRMEAQSEGNSKSSALPKS